MEVPPKTVLSSVIMQQNQAVQLKDMLKIANFWIIVHIGQEPLKGMQKIPDSKKTMQ